MKKLKLKINEEIPYYIWKLSSKEPPPDINEDILVFYIENEYINITRSCILLQHINYIKTAHPNIQEKDFYWMRIRRPDDKPHFPD
jgi:hypothetical protein